MTRLSSTLMGTLVCVRGITLHHRMREDKNPFSTKIKAFDERIKAFLQQTEERRSICVALKEKKVRLHSETSHRDKSLLQEIQDLEQRRDALQDIPQLSSEDVKE